MPVDTTAVSVAPHAPDAGAAGAVSVTVVICAYSTQRWELLCSSVESALSQHRPVDQILLVIDHNDVLHQHAVRHFGSGTRVTVLENTFARGLSGARNTGVQASTGTVVAFLDDDAAAEPGWSHALVSHYRDPDVAVVGGHAEPRWPGARPGWFPEEFDWVVGCSYRGQPRTIAPVRNPLGCNMSVRRDVLDDVAGFDGAVGRVGTTPTGCEETELCIRIRQHDPAAQIVYDPGMRVHHYVAPERITPRYFYSRCYHEGRSKAVMSRLVGAADGLRSERVYTRTVLPMAVLRSLMSPRNGGIRRAAAVIAGLAVTATGYAYGRVLAIVNGAR